MFWGEMMLPRPKPAPGAKPLIVMSPRTFVPLYSLPLRREVRAVMHFLRAQSVPVRTGLDVGFTNAGVSRLLRLVGGYWMTVEPTQQRRTLVAAALGQETVLNLGKEGDLPFEDNCLRFHENNRAVRTASSEQVRRPINRDGVERWRAYGMRLNITAGTAVRFEPGQQRTVELVDYAGARAVFGFRAQIQGAL